VLSRNYSTQPLMRQQRGRLFFYHYNYKQKYYQAKAISKFAHSVHPL
jgi:hypothetical protein